MRWLKRGMRTLTRAPGVPQARHVTERAVAPYLRAQVQQLGVDHGLTVDRLHQLELKVDGLVASVNAVELHMPAVLNAISSTNGTARLLAREMDVLRDQSDALRNETGALRNEAGSLRSETAHVHERLDALVPMVQNGDDAVRNELRPHIDTIRWLLERVETVRAEMLHELRYGQVHDAKFVEPKIVNPSALDADETRLNLGAGHIAIAGFVNVDLRELPGIDVVAPIDSLPFEPGTVDEIFSSHTIEHFPEEQLRRKLLPYWASLLKPGGTFRAIVPDLEAMTKSYATGEISFDQLRAVVYGGQEYEGDFHFTGFTPATLSNLLVESGFERPEVIAAGRPNGDCLEFEISAVKRAP